MVVGGPGKRFEMAGGRCGGLPLPAVLKRSVITCIMTTEFIKEMIMAVGEGV